MFKMKKLFQNKSNLLIFVLSFLLPVLLLLGVYVVFGVYPFGERSLLITDMSQQYVDFHSWLYDVIHGQDNLFFSWRTGLGMNMTGVYSFYIASPFSFLVLLFPKSGIPEALLLITLLKVGCAGLSFSFYAHRILGCKGVSGITFSVLYALMSYVMVYALNIMWLDGIILLPIVLVFIHLLFEKGKILPLMLSLVFLFIAQFYIAFMVGLFAALYFFALAFIGRVSGKEFLKKAGLFALSAGIAAMIAAFLLIPTYLSLHYVYLYIASSNVGEATLTPFQIFSKLLYSSYDSITYGLPNLFCGTLCLLLSPLFFLNSRIDRRLKLSAGIMIAILFLSMTFWPLNILWHAGDEPTWFPYRFSFLFCFCMIVMSALCYRHRAGIGVKQLLSVSGVLVLLVSLLPAFGFEYISAELMLSSICLISLYTVLLFFMRSRRLLAGVMGFLILVCCCTEMFGNGNQMVRRLDDELGYDNREDYVGFYEAVSPVIAELESRDGGWYRVENQTMRNSNDALSLGYHGMAHYSSFTNQHASLLLCRLGISSTVQNRFLRYYGSSNVTDSLLGIKYVLGTEEPHAGYRMIFSLDGIRRVYENPDALPIGFVVDSGVLRYSAADDDPFFSQNSLLNLMAGDSTLYYTPVAEVNFESSRNVTIEEESGEWLTLSSKGSGFVTFRILNTEDQRLFFFLPENSLSPFTRVTVNGQGFDGGCHITGVMDLGFYKQGDMVSVTVNIPSGTSYLQKPKVCAFDSAAFGALADRLKKNGMYDVELGHSTLSGKVKAERDGVLFTSIPVDPGWSVYVDGESVSPQTVGGGFLALPLTAGEHTLFFSFAPEGLRTGTVISLFGLFALIGAAWLIDFGGFKRLSSFCEKRRRGRKGSA